MTLLLPSMDMIWLGLIHFEWVEFGMVYFRLVLWDFHMVLGFDLVLVQIGSIQLLGISLFSSGFSF